MEDEDDYEHDLLAKIREIAALDDGLAIERVAEFVNEVRFGTDWERDRARDTLESIRAQTAHMSTCLAKRIPLEHWEDGQLFMRRVQRLGTHWTPEVQKQFAGDIAEVRQLAEPVAKAAAVYGAVALIETTLAETIVSTQIAERMLRDIRDTAEFLLDIDPSEAHSALIRRARERIARYRWQKKVDEAEVVEAGGNDKKGQKLRLEASVMLRQDWTRIFPGEGAPSN
jgi:hypothetical protein